MESQAHQNLIDAASIDRSTGWTKARLIACSVEPGKQGGKHPVRGRNDKLTIDEAADITKMSDKTIRAYLKAWNKAADGLRCTPSKALTPADGTTARLPEDTFWDSYWIATLSKGTRGGA